MHLQPARIFGGSIIGRILWGSLASTQFQARSYSAVPETLRPAFGFCVQQVRQYDYLNYVWVAQMPPELRPALFTLRAFNIETALIAENVRSKEAVVGQIRFQWWRDVIKAAYDGTPPNHPVALALSHVLRSDTDNDVAGCVSGGGVTGANTNINTGPVVGTDGGASACGGGSCSTSTEGAAAVDARATGPSSGSATGPVRYNRYCFKRIIDTREADFLDTQPPLHLQALEQYAEGTSSQLMYLQLAAAGVKNPDADHVASHLGRAAGISTLLRGTAAHAAARRCYLPVDLCAEARVSQEDVYGGVVSEGLRDVVHKVASLAKGHLDEARRLAPRLPRGAARVMLPAVGVGKYLEALEAANFNPYDPKLIREHGGSGEGSAPLAYVLAIKWHQMRGTY